MEPNIPLFTDPWFVACVHFIFVLVIVEKSREVLKKEKEFQTLHLRMYCTTMKHTGSQIGDSIRGCKTQGCDGTFVPVAVKSNGLGGGLSVLILYQV